MKWIDQLSGRYPRRRVFITGGGGGLGLALAQAFVHGGWTVGLTDVDAAALEAAAAALGERCQPFAFDAANEAAFEQAARNFVERNGGIDILINNAGIGAGGAVHEFTLEQWNRVIDVNFKSCLHGCYFFLPTFLKQNSGHIINIASAAAFASGPRMAAYNATKAAVVSLTETLKAELFATAVRTTVVMPTFFKTNIGRNTIGAAEDRLFAQRIVEAAPMNAAQAAEQVLKAATKNEFYVVFPRKAVVVWWIKRFFPVFFLNLAPKIFAKRKQKFMQEHGT